MSQPLIAAAAELLFDRQAEDGASLVAAGKSYREIATALVINEHTVRRHLQNIFAQARRLVADRGERVRVRARARLTRRMV